MLTEKQMQELEKLLAKADPEQLTTKVALRIAADTDMPIKTVESLALGMGLIPLRYRKNIGTLGIEGQKKLLETTVIVIGLGGLGGYVIEQSARAGIGHIIAADHDAFDETNLNRQILSDKNTIGKKKVVAARQRLESVNPATTFDGFEMSFEKIPSQLWQKADLVFDCLDNVADRFVLADFCTDANVTLIHGAIAGWFAQVAVVPPSSGLIGKIYHRKNPGIEKDIGTPGFTAATAASLMVTQAIKILTGKIPANENMLLFLDLLNNEWQTMDI